MGLVWALECVWGERARVQGGYHQMRNAFKHFNKDANHFVSFDNFARTLRDFELKLLPADVKTLFDRYDRCAPLINVTITLFVITQRTLSVIQRARSVTQREL